MKNTRPVPGVARGCLPEGFQATKNLAIKITDVGMEKGRMLVSGYASTDALDLDDEVILPEAFEEHMPAFMQNPVYCWQHMLWDPIGSVKMCHIDDDGLYFDEVELSPTKTVLDEYWPLIQTRTVRSQSVGFVPIKWEDRQVDGVEEPVRHYTEVQLWECSAVTIPANPECRIDTVEDKQLKAYGPDAAKLFPALWEVERRQRDNPQDFDVASHCRGVWPGFGGCGREHREDQGTADGQPKQWVDQPAQTFTVVGTRAPLDVHDPSGTEPVPGLETGPSPDAVYDQLTVTEQEEYHPPGISLAPMHTEPELRAYDEWSCHLLYHVDTGEPVMRVASIAAEDGAPVLQWEKMVVALSQVMGVRSPYRLAPDTKVLALNKLAKLYELAGRDFPALALDEENLQAQPDGVLRTAGWNDLLFRSDEKATLEAHRFTQCANGILSIARHWAKGHGELPTQATAHAAKEVAATMLILLRNDAQGAGTDTEGEPPRCDEPRALDATALLGGMLRAVQETA